MFVQVSLCSQCDFDPISPFPSISTLANPSSSSHPCTPGLLFRLFSGFPWAPVTPPQAILQTSTEQKSLHSPSTDSRSLLACQSEPPACPSGPNRFLPPTDFYSSTSVHGFFDSTWDLLIRRSCDSYLPLLTPSSTTESPPSSLLHPWTPLKSGSVQSPVGWSSAHPPQSTAVCPSGSSLFSDHLYGGSWVLCSTGYLSTCAFAPTNPYAPWGSAGSLTCFAFTASSTQPHTHTKCLFFYSFTTDIYISASTICSVIWIVGAYFSYLTIQ